MRPVSPMADLESQLPAASFRLLRDDRRDRNHHRLRSFRNRRTRGSDRVYGNV